jgi:transcriptional regulator with XRE-family HTH domain
MCAIRTIFGLNLRYAHAPTVVVTLQERIRQRLRTLVTTKNVSLKVLGERLHLSPSGVGRILNDEGYNILLQHIEGFCNFFQMTPSELIVEPNALIQPVQPDERHLLHLFRQLTYTQKQGLLSVLEGRTLQAPPRKRARLGRSELTEEQQLVVDLYARSEPQAREGVLKVLRGTARKAATDARASSDGNSE